MKWFWAKRVCETVKQGIKNDFQYLKLLLICFSRLENEWVANETILIQAYVSKSKASYKKTTFSTWSYFWYAFKGLSKCFYRFFTLEVAPSTIALLFGTFACLKLVSLSIHSFSSLEKHIRSSYRYWKSFLYSPRCCLIHTWPGNPMSYTACYVCQNTIKW